RFSWPCGGRFEGEGADRPNSGGWARGRRKPESERGMARARAAGTGCAIPSLVGVRSSRSGRGQLVALGRGCYRRMGAGKRKVIADVEIGSVCSRDETQRIG